LRNGFIEKLKKSIRFRSTRYFARRLQVVSQPSPIVSLCFDDFPQSAATVGAKLLEANGMSASYYFCSEFVGTTTEGNQQFDIEDLHRVNYLGHELGCHTASHPSVPEISTTVLQHEIEKNAKFLRDIGVHRKIRTFAYPFGDVDLRSKRYLSSQFDACRGAFAGINTKKFDLSLLSCVSLEEKILNEKSVTQWINQAIKERAWLILLTHDIQDNPTPFGVTPRFYESLIRQIRHSNAKVLTVESAIDYLRQ